ncbi:MerR family transcriptional regulator [Paenibacillus sepulcri]|uniref:MerR family transcriptional regulator n=1 Tax=Paenibacillus sepulcri TaxID=359917 RepID=A0ABS7C261_9BACL|nr:MerR family transcriptional regulator [Paenibacillus sepulcri]
MEEKVMYIGMVCELTGLSERQIRYYEERKLVFPVRTKGGVRKYSFEDVDNIREINRNIKDGFRTFELKGMLNKRLHGRGQA